MQICLIRVTTSIRLYSCIRNRRKTTIIAFVNSNFSTIFLYYSYVSVETDKKTESITLKLYQALHLKHWHLRKTFQAILSNLDTDFKISTTMGFSKRNTSELRQYSFPRKRSREAYGHYSVQNKTGLGKLCTLSANTQLSMAAAEIGTILFRYEF